MNRPTRRSLLGLLVAVGSVSTLGLASGRVLAADAPPQPVIVSRAEWGAKPPLAGIEAFRHEPRFITIHHTAVKMAPKTTLEKKLKGLQAFSQKPAKVGKKTREAWPDIPYHYYIDASGRIGEGREVVYAGDTNTGYDTRGHIQIVVEGEFNVEQPRPAQLESLKALVLWLAARYRVPAGEVRGHGDIAQTECPGKALIPVVPELAKAVAALGPSP